MKRLLLIPFLSLVLMPLAYADYKAELTQDDAQAKIDAHQITVIDVRTPEEFAGGHVPSAINIPYDQIGKRLTEIPVARDQPILLYCRSGRRSEMAEKTLTSAGYTQLYHLQGDMIGWDDNNRPIAK